MPHCYSFFHLSSLHHLVTTSSLLFFILSFIPYSFSFILYWLILFISAAFCFFHIFNMQCPLCVYYNFTTGKKEPFYISFKFPE